MKITWHGHACFSVESGGSALVLDPYQDPDGILNLPPLSLTADRVLCSHEHTDHNCREAVRLTGKPCGIHVETVGSWHDGVQGALLGPNTIHILSDGEVRAAHFGDLESELTDSQIAAIGKLDVMMINVGGFEYSLAAFADRLCRLLSPRIVIPMHYRAEDYGFYKAGTLEEFLSLRSDVVYHPGNSLVVDRAAPPQTAVLRYLRPGSAEN